jgi:putative Mn2+ efflux pump MntP
MTDFWMILIIAIGLAMDCFAVSLCIGASPAPQNHRSIFRVSFHFGLFQGGMTLLGWLLGSTVVNLIANFDHWIAMALLGWIGGRMIYEGLSKDDSSPIKACDDPTRGSSLVMLSVATSIDALGVGLSLALLKVNVWGASIIIGLVSLIVSIVGLLGGKKLNQRFGKQVEVLGGLVLVLIGLRIVITHLLA